MDAGLRRFYNSALWLTGTFAGSAYLFLLYAVTLWMVVGSLSAILVHDRLEDINSIATFGDVDRAYNRYREQVNMLWEDTTNTPAQIAAEVQNLRDAEPLSSMFDTFEFFEFDFEDNTDGAGSFSGFLQLPREILVMQLTMAMGMLGSVVTMTWSFVRRDSGLTVRRFLILPAVGALSAFIILIFAKAGQISLTSGDSGDVLNPYFLSFLGIISGLLSERAYARIANIGENFFAIDDDRTRWGVRIEQTMKEEQVDIAQIAEYLKVAPNAAQDIVSGRLQATPLQQLLIASVLRRRQREIFTDLPPPQTNRPQAAADGPVLQNENAPLETA